MENQPDRRQFLRGSLLATSGTLIVGAAQAAEDAGRPVATTVPQDYPRDRPAVWGPVGSPTDRGKLVPGRRPPGEPPVSVVTPDVPHLSPTVRDGIKEFHLIAEPVKREFLPHLVMDVWGFNGSMPGPTIEVTQGDRVRVIVENRLPEPTLIHWHGFEIPVSQDGVPGLVQDLILHGQASSYD